MRAAPRPASPALIAKQIVCSDDACEIRMTLTSWAASAREQPFGGAGHADHSEAAQREQRDASIG